MIDTIKYFQHYTELDFHKWIANGSEPITIESLEAAYNEFLVCDLIVGQQVVVEWILHLLNLDKLK